MSPVPPPEDPVITAAFRPSSSPRSVLVYAPMAYSTPHFETDLEIAQRHLDLGDRVAIMICDAALRSCQLNPQRDPARCLHCISRNVQGTAQLSPAPRVLGLLDGMEPEDQASLDRIPEAFRDTDELRRYRFEGFDAGLATVSSMIDFTKSLEVDVRGHRQVIAATLHAAVSSYLALRRHLRAHRYDRVYIYNGRWSMMRSAVRACEETETPFYTHERGADFRRFGLYAGVLPHDKPDFLRQVSRLWNLAAPLPASRPVAEAFFAERRTRVEKAWFSFVKEQETGRLPPDWSDHARQFVLFTSSEFECAAVSDGAEGRIFPSQAGSIAILSRELVRRQPDLHLWVRVHPNDNSEAAKHRWRQATAGLANVTLIEPDAKVDSYALLDRAERILTFGSTVGIEATYWGKPAICADHSFFGGLDAQYEAESLEQLLELLLRPNLPPKPRENALAFGYYLNSYGATFQNFETATISDYAFQSPFRGRCLRPDFGDLRQRMLALLAAGEDRRLTGLARALLRLQSGDILGHSLLILALLRLNEIPAALTAMESAAKITPEAASAVLKHTAKALLDAGPRLLRTSPGAYPDFARRVAAAFRLVPELATIGNTLAAAAALAPVPAGASAGR